MRFLLSIFLLGYVVVGYAQRGQIFFKHFTVVEGLPSNEVHGLYEDRHGYLWITTDRGIVRYDGYDFEEMPVEGMPAVFPWFGIYEDTIHDKIYFTGMKASLALYDRGRLKVHAFNDKISGLYGDDYYTISSFASRNDSIWMGIDNVGVLLVTPDGAIVREPVPRGIHFDIGQRTHKRWVGTFRPGEQPVVTLHINWGDKQTKDTVHVSEPTRTEWLPVGDHDLFFCGEQVLVFYKGIRVAAHSLPYSVHSVCMVEEGGVVIGFKNGGAVLYRLTGNTQQPQKERAWLEGLTVTHVKKDKQGGVWIATAENGLYYIYPSRAMVWKGKGKISVLQKQDGRVYVGGASGVIDIYKDGLLTEVIPNIAVPVSSNVIDAGAQRVVKTIADEFSKGGMTNGAPVNYSIGNMRFAGAGMLPEFMCKDLLSDLPDRDYAQLMAQRVTSMAKDRDGRLWIGTYGGLYTYGHGRLSLFGTGGPYANLFSDRIVQTMVLKNGNIAVATLGSGLAILRGQEVVHVVNKDKGLNGTIINNIEVQGDTVWMATNRGLGKLFQDADSLCIVHYGSAWGLPTPAIYELLVCGDWIYFRWIDQLVSIHKRLLSNRLLPSGPPVITSVTVNGVAQDLTSEGVLRHDQKEVKINFNSVNLANGPNQLYRYTLKGIDEKWYYTTAREAVFTNLSSGNYTFVVQSADGHGAFLPGSAEYRFEVLPAFWQRWWFPFAVGLPLLVITYLYYRSRLQTIKRNNQIMLELAEHEQKALVQMINPHFIFNVLNTAQAAILKEDKMVAASIIARFAKLMRLSLELSRNQYVLLSQEAELLRRYIDLEIIRTPGKFVYYIAVAEGLNEQPVKIPGMLVQPFVENAIKHGIMHLIGRTGEIYIRFFMEGKTLMCEVSDNGIGRTEATRISAGRVQKHHSVGIAITCRRMKLLHEERGTDYYYHVVDKYDEENIPLGTEVIFSVPYHI